MNKTITIGARSSKLSLVQSNIIKNILEDDNPDLHFKLVPISKKDDSFESLEKPKNLISLKDVFTKHIEDSLYRKDIDMAIHSLKDLDTRNKKNLSILFTGKRKNPYDVFLSIQYPDFDSMPQGAVIGTSSLRRKNQILYHYPHLRVKEIRGNIHTRIHMLYENPSVIDALILADAGLKRLPYGKKLFQKVLSPEKFVPAPGQGALAVQCLLENKELLSPLFKKIKQRTIQDFSIYIERQILDKMNASCTFPLGVYAQKDMNSNDYKLYFDFYQKKNDKIQRIFFTFNEEIQSFKEADLFIDQVVKKWKSLI